MASKLEVLEALQKAPAGFEYFKPRDYQKMEKDGLLEVNLKMVDDTGAHACRLTPAGIEYLNTINETPGAIAVPKKDKPMASTFVIKTAPIPATKRKGGAGRPSKYPFDSLEVGQYFFVPATTDQPDPAKSLGSVVTSANRRYATETSETKLNRKGEAVAKLAYTRRFVVRPVTEDGLAGAGVWREK